MKISGLPYEEAKELTLWGYGFEIRYYGPCEPYLLAKRDSEGTSMALSDTCQTRLSGLGYKLLSCKPVKDNETVWTFQSSKAA